MQKFKTTLMDEAALMRAVRRISHEIVERNKGTENLVLVGIKSRGIPLAKMIPDNISALEGVEIPLETLDTSLYRDDIEKPGSVPPVPLSTDITGKRIILVDDVLYTGRTARAAIEAVFSMGRPARIQPRDLRHGAEHGRHDDTVYVRAGTCRPRQAYPEAESRP